MKPTFYSDPGHAWLAVSRQELIDLGILHKVSQYSYQRGEKVYLEEDCDATLYVNLIYALGKKYDYTVRNQAQGYSRIRNYNRVSMWPHEFRQSKANEQKTDALLAEIAGKY